MGLITKKLKVMGDKGEREINCLFDTGASVSFIRKDIQETLATPFLLKEPKVFSLGDGKGKIEIKEAVHLDFCLKEGRIFDEIFVSDSLAEEIIIGARTMQIYRIKLDMENDDIIVDKRALELKLI
ncbi:MAG: retropepsin-like aspartic protease [bacterium]